MRVLGVCNAAALGGEIDSRLVGRDGTGRERCVIFWDHHRPGKGGFSGGGGRGTGRGRDRWIHMY